MDKRTAEEDAQAKIKAASGRTAGMSGRDLFTFNPDLFADDDSEDGGEEFDITQYKRHESGDEDSDEDEEEANGGGRSTVGGSSTQGDVEERLKGMSVNGESNGGAGEKTVEKGKEK